MVWFPSVEDLKKIITGLVVYLGGNPVMDGEDREQAYNRGYVIKKVTSGSN